MLCIVARHGAKVLRFQVPDAETVLGASPSSPLLVPFPGVSRAHATVARLDDGVLLTDAGSKNGIFGPEGRVRECFLKPGESVRVGEASLTIEDGPTSDLDIAMPCSDGEPAWVGPQRTASSGPWNAGSSAALALRFVREVEKPDDCRSPLSRKEFLEKSTEILGALSIVILEVGHPGDETLVDFGGEAPSSALQEAIAREASSAKGPVGSSAVLQEILGWPHLSARLRDILLVARFPESFQSLEAWQVDFFGYVLDRCIDRGGHSVQTTGREAPVAERMGEEDSLCFPPGMVLGSSRAVTELLSQVRATVRSRMDVLLTGETGTGKEFFAKMVHLSGPMAKGPFVAINCAAIPGDLLEAELFGVQARVATGVDPRVGLFQRANGGAIFLDEIGELAEPLQVKLLRVLQEREVLPLGAPVPKKVDLRVISASNRNLSEAAEAGKFRPDLFYRLRGLQFHIPPLRDRLEDLPSLVLAFAERAAAEHGKRLKGVSRKALDILQAHDWPGNIRELQNEVNRAVLVCPDGGALGSEHFRPVGWEVERRRKQREKAYGGEMQGQPPVAGAGSRRPTAAESPVASAKARTLNLQARIDELERAMIEEALKTAKGNKSLAARMLGVTRNGLAMKVARLFSAEALERSGR